MRLLFPWEPSKIVKGVSDVEYLKGKYPDNVWMEYEFAKALLAPASQRLALDTEIVVIHNER